MKFLHFAFITLLLSGCSAFLFSKAPSPRAEYKENSRKWQESETAHYRFSISIACWCPVNKDMPVTVEVAGGQVVSVIDKDGVPISIEEDKAYLSFGRLLTLEGLFEYARHALSEADDVQVLYDPEKGYPVLLEVDWVTAVGYDDNIYITVADFEELP